MGLARAARCGWCKRESEPERIDRGGPHRIPHLPSCPAAPGGFQFSVEYALRDGNVYEDSYHASPSTATGRRTALARELGHTGHAMARFADDPERGEVSDDEVCERCGSLWEWDADECPGCGRTIEQVAAHLALRRAGQLG